MGKLSYAQRLYLWLDREKDGDYNEKGETGFRKNSTGKKERYMRVQILAVREDFPLFTEYIASRNANVYPARIPAEGGVQPSASVTETKKCQYIVWSGSKICYKTAEDGAGRYLESWGSECLEVQLGSIDGSEDMSAQICRGQIYLNDRRERPQPRWLIEEYRAMRRWVVNTARLHPEDPMGKLYVFPAAMKRLEGRRVRMDGMPGERKRKGLLDFQHIFEADRTVPEPVWLFDRENRVFLACREKDSRYIPVPFVYRADLIRDFLRKYPEYDTYPALHRMSDESRMYHDFALHGDAFWEEWNDYKEMRMRDAIGSWREANDLTDIPLEVPEVKERKGYIRNGQEIAEELQRMAQEGRRRTEEYMNMKDDENILYVNMM